MAKHKKKSGRGPGRPPVDPSEYRGYRLQVRLNEEERDLIEAAAAAAGEAVGAWMRDAAVRAAKRRTR